MMVSSNEPARSVVRPRRALKAVRELRGLDIGQVASFTSIPANRLEAFEDGRNEPSRRQMQKLAEAYGVATYSLYAESVPELAPLPTDFRKAHPIPASLGPRGIRALLASEQISRFTLQLATALGEQPADFTASIRRGANSFTKLAADLRAVFDKWRRPREDKFRFSGPPEQQFLNSLRIFFETQGGVLNINDVPPNEYMGFFVRPAHGVPTIFVNRNIQSKKAQLFTLVHEYAHSLDGKIGISNPFELRNITERSCNTFAAEFLAPMAEFGKVVEDLPKRTLRDTSELITIVSARSLLSKHATAIRLVEADYISQSQLAIWERKWRKFPGFEKQEERETTESQGGVAPHAKRISEIGYLPIFLADKAIRAKIIDTYDVEKGIHLSESLQQRAFSLVTRRFEIARS